MSKASLPDDELARIVFTAVERSDEPLTSKRVRETLSVPLRQPERRIQTILDQLARAGRIHRWPPKQANQKRTTYWIHDPKQYAADRIVECVGEGPLSRTDLRAKATSRIPSFSQTKVDQLITDLCHAGRIIKHPPVGRYRVRYAAVAPDPTPYLKQAIEAFNNKSRQLSKECGLNPQEIIAAFDAGVGFPRDVGNTGSPVGLGETLLAILRLVPHRQVIPVNDLRQIVGKPKNEFDQAALELHRRGRAYLHGHDDPYNVNEYIREELVYDKDKDRYFGGIALR